MYVRSIFVHVIEGIFTFFIKRYSNIPETFDGADFCIIFEQLNNYIMNTPAELKYTKDHEWVRIEGNTATIGITDFAQSELGDIVFVDVDTVDDELSAGDVFGSLEAVNTVSDLFLPIDGTVSEFNSELEDQPELLNSDPYGKGWIIKLELAEGADHSALLTAEEYQASLG